LAFSGTKGVVCFGGAATGFFGAAVFMAAGFLICFALGGGLAWYSLPLDSEALALDSLLLGEVHPSSSWLLQCLQLFLEPLHFDAHQIR